MPTNRPCAPAIYDAVLECGVLQEETSHEYIFLLVEQGQAGFEENADALRRAARLYGLRCIHLTQARWDAIISMVLRAAAFSSSDAERIRALLSPRLVAYGAGPNKAFIVAAALGVNAVHRRDSDQVLDERSDGKAFPGILEARAIGRPAGDVIPLVNKGSLSAAELSEPVYFVGSNLFGDPGHDRRDLLAAGAEYVLKLEELSRPTTPLSELRAAAHNKFVAEPRIRHPDDFYEVCDSKRTAIGVSCLHRMFLELPENPICDTLGSDYFQKTLLYQLGRPVLFQSRKMRHSYDPERAGNRDLVKVVDYALRDLRNLILLRIRSALNRDVREHREAYLLPDGSLDADQYADGLLKVGKAELPQAAEIPAEYSNVYDLAADRTSGALQARLRAVAAASGSGNSDFVADVHRGVLDYSWLIRHWRRLVRTASATAETLQGYLEP